MTAPGSPSFPSPLPSGAEFQFFPARMTKDWGTRQDPLDSGHLRTGVRWPRPIRGFPVACETLTDADFDKVHGFLESRKGGAEAFWFPIFQSMVASPYDGPALSQAAGGTIGARVYYAKHTWSDGTNETRPSEETTLSVSANYLASLTMPSFPSGVTEARIYLATSSGAQKRVSKLATDTQVWTEPFNQVNGDSASGQKVCNVTSPVTFAAGEYIVIGLGTAREEKRIVESVGVGTVTVTVNLTYTHLLADADTLQIDPTSGAVPPTSNTLLEWMWAVLAGGKYAYEQKAPNIWRMSFELQETFV